MVIICRLKSGDIYLTYIVKYMLISFDKQLLRSVVCFVCRTIVVYTMDTEHVLATLHPVFVRASLPSKWTRKPPPLRPGLLQLTGTILVIYSSVRAALQRHGRLARPPSRLVHVSTLAYNAVADSLSAPAYKHRDRFTRPHRFTTPRPVHP